MSRLQWFLAAFLWMLLIAGYAAGEIRAEDRTSAGSAFLESGIMGRVVLGPQCPVVSPGMEEKCKEKPYQATLVVRRKESGREVSRVTTDRNGAFRMALPPGVYIVEPLPTALPLPVGHPETVTVEPGKFTDVTIHYDSGIR